jgi:hypothetical protein
MIVPTILAAFFAMKALWPVIPIATANDTIVWTGQSQLCVSSRIVPVWSTYKPKAVTKKNDITCLLKEFEFWPNTTCRFAKKLNTMATVVDMMFDCTRERPALLESMLYKAKSMMVLMSPTTPNLPTRFNSLADAGVFMATIGLFSM